MASVGPRTPDTNRIRVNISLRVPRDGFNRDLKYRVAPNVTLETLHACEVRLDNIPADMCAYWLHTASGTPLSIDPQLTFGEIAALCSRVRSNEKIKLVLGVGRLVLRFVAISRAAEGSQRFLPVYGYPLNDVACVVDGYLAELRGDLDSVGRGPLPVFPGGGESAAAPRRARDKGGWMNEINSWILKGGSVFHQSVLEPVFADTDASKERFHHQSNDGDARTKPYALSRAASSRSILTDIAYTNLTPRHKKRMSASRGADAKGTRRAGSKAPREPDDEHRQTEEGIRVQEIPSMAELARGGSKQGIQLSDILDSTRTFRDSGSSEEAPRKLRVEEVEYLYACPDGTLISEELENAVWVVDSTVMGRHLLDAKTSRKVKFSPDASRREYWAKIANGVEGDVKAGRDALSSPGERDIRYWASYMGPKFRTRRLKAVWGPPIMLRQPLLQYVETVFGDDADKAQWVELATALVKSEDRLWQVLIRFAQYVYYFKGLIIRRRELAEVLGWRSPGSESSPYDNITSRMATIVAFLESLPSKHHASDSKTADARSEEAKRAHTEYSKRIAAERPAASKILAEYETLLDLAHRLQEKAIANLDQSLPNQLKFQNFDVERFVAEERKAGWNADDVKAEEERKLAGERVGDEPVSRGTREVFTAVPLARQSSSRTVHPPDPTST